MDRYSNFLFLISVLILILFVCKEKKNNIKNKLYDINGRNINLNINNDYKNKSNEILDLKKTTSKKQDKDTKKIKIKKNVNKNNKDIIDICTKLEKCSIEEISKYLIKQGKKKSFPDITLRR